MSHVLMGEENGNSEKNTVMTSQVGASTLVTKMREAYGAKLQELSDKKVTFFFGDRDSGGMLGNFAIVLGGDFFLCVVL